MGNFCSAQLQQFLIMRFVSNVARGFPQTPASQSQKMKLEKQKKEIWHSPRSKLNEKVD